jgi:hypothetical protein
MFERALQTIDSSVMLPYWDWSLDSQNPANSVLFDRNAFGGNGENGTNCVRTGVAAGWIGGVNNPGCLKRCSKWGVLYSPEVVTALLNRADTFQSFATAIENGPHGLVHMQLGGACGDMSTMASPNDPLFYLHHAMVDKIWWKWQNACPEYVSMFSEPTNQTLAPFGVTIASVLPIHSTQFCYTYSANEGDLPQSHTCRSTSTTNSTTSNSTSNALVENNWLEKSIQTLITGHVQAAIKFDTRLTLKAPKTNNLHALVASKFTFGTKYYFRAQELTVKAPEIGQSDDIHLRFPSELSPEFIKMMRLDANQVRNVEDFVKFIVDEYNNRPGYVSPSAIRNQRKWSENVGEKKLY